MRTIKYGLLGCAAVLLAASAAQAADLPVKAKPVEYVKVCSLYGAGFWYVPGTDTCLKVGAYVRAQAEYGSDGAGGPLGAGNAFGRTDRTDNSDFGFRSRQVLSLDMRTQTEYGTLRSYIEFGAQLNAGGNATAGANGASADSIFVDRGFVQFAGFTVGRVRSYFDINAYTSYSYSNWRVSGDTSNNGIAAWAYTAQLGNGVSASLSFEDPGNGSGSGRGRLVSDLAATPFSVTGLSTATDNRGTQYPDVVGALRIDQAWGYAQVAAALHDVSGGYYGATDLTTSGHPGDKLGWAVTGGFTLNDVLGLKGDQFGLQAAYSQGAAGYVTRPTGMWGIWGGNGSMGLGNVTDGIFTNGTDIELTTVWGLNGFYQHFWNPNWKTSFYGGYVEVDHSSTAKSMICGGASGGAVAGAVTGYAGLSNVSNCDPDFSFFQAGTRTQWNPVPNLDLGVDVLYTRLNTAFKGTANVAQSGARPATVNQQIDDQDILSVMFRVQRNFLP